MKYFRIICVEIRQQLNPEIIVRIYIMYASFQPSGISEEVFRQLETVQNRYDSTTAAAFRAVQKSGEMVVRTLDPRQFIRLASETAPKINIDTNVSGRDRRQVDKKTSFFRSMCRLLKKKTDQ